MTPDPVPPTEAELTVSAKSRPGRLPPVAEVYDDPTRDGDGEDSEITVISKKPPQQFCTSAFDWRKVGELLIGKQLGSFRLDSLLGVGGMGAVFRATDLQLDRQVAVKVLNSAENDPEAERRFRIEAQSAARLDHQNIARVFHVGQDQGWNYIVLELVAGQTLRQWVANRGPLDLKTAIHFFRQLAAALDHAHQRNIIHRDIKPSNVLVADDLTVKIVDMGLARIQKNMESADHDAEAGMTLGTFDYLAPEQARDPRQADQQSDLYSLGCTLYFALVGRPPFADASSIEKLLSHSSSERPRVTAARPDLPASVDRLVAAMMAPRKADRVATAREFERLLLQLRIESRPVTRSVPRPLAEQRSWQRLLPMLAAMSAVLVAVSLLLEGGWRDPGIRLPDWPSGEAEVATPTRTSTNVELGTVSPSPVVNPPASLVAESSGELGVRTLATEATGAGRREEANRLPAVAANPLDDLRLSNSAMASPGRLAGWSLGRPFEFQTPSLLVPFLSPAEEPAASESARFPWWQVPDIPQAAVPETRGLGTRSDAMAELGTTSSTAAVTTLQVVPATMDGAGLPAAGVDQPPRPSVQRVASLELAIASLSRYPNVRKIELQFSGPHRVAPLRIPPSNLREIQAAAGHRPMLQFSQDFLVAPKTAPQIILESGQLEISGVDFVWDPSLTSGADLSPQLFEIPLLSRLVFKDCTFQQVAGESTRRGWVDAVAAPLVPSTATRPSLTWVQTNTLPLTAWEGRKQGVLSFERCAFHGSADLVSARAAHATLLRLTDCLVVTTGAFARWVVLNNRMTSTGIEIEIERSTVIAGQGLLQTVVEGEQLAAPVNLFAHDSLFVTTDLQRGLMHHNTQLVEATSGLGGGRTGVVTELAVDRPADWLFFDGFNNTLLADWVWSESDRETDLNLGAINFEQASGSRWFRHDMINQRALSSSERSHLLTRVFSRPLAASEAETLSTYLGLDVVGFGVDAAVLPKFPGHAPSPRTP